MKTPSVVTAGLFVALTVGACGGQLPEPWDAAAAGDKDLVRAEALLDVYNQGSAVYGSGLDLCVSLDAEANPTKVFRNLEGRGGRVWKSQRCVARGLNLVEAISGRQALQVMVSHVEMLGPGQARAQAGFLRGPWREKGES